MPTSPTERSQRVDAILDALLDLPADQQTDYLRRAAADDPEVHDEVLRLLRAHRRAEGFLDASGPRVAQELLEAADLLPAIEAPERIGPWRIVRPLGRGGMGAVYLGERADGQFEQRAAVKLIQGGSPGLVRRFVEERRILAMLEHPGIARLIEGGLTPGGQPYFAMELIEGVHLDRYCDEHELSIDGRLELVDQVCDAVSYAHHHLIIHRDLKPSNILVTPAGRVKLLDFGIAKLLSGEPGAGETDTRLPVMTPEFAAPEQVRGEGVSTATDVYALGVLLYLLVTRQYPYEVRNKSLAELTRIVCEAEPPRPSARAPEALRRQVRGDLDLIVLTALHKDPKRRYQSPAALADDLRRFRAHHPILARPDSAGYRARKFVARHRAGVAAAAVGVVLLAAGAARERVLRQRAEIEARKATEVGDYLVGVFDVADPYAIERRDGRDVSARDLLDQGAARVDSMLAGQREVQAQLRSVLGRAYTNLGDYDQATRLLRQALAQHQAVYGRDHLTVAEDMERLGDALVQQDKYEEAEPLLREALALRRRLGGASDATASTLDRLATLLQRRGEVAEAEPLFREALTMRRRLLGDTANVVALSLNNLGVLLVQTGAYDEAEPIHREAVAINVRRLGETHQQTAEAVHNLAQVQQQRGALAEAESLYRRALAAKRKTVGDAHPSVTVNLNNLGAMLMDHGRVEEAEPLIREAVALDRRIFGERHSYVAASLRNLATVLRLKGEFAEAERQDHATMAIVRSLFGSAHPAIADNLNNLGHDRRQQGDLAGAVKYYREALEMGRAKLGENHVNTIAYTVNLGRAVEAQGGHAPEAEQLLRDASSRLDTANARDLPWYLNAQTGLGLALVAQGRAAEGREQLEAALGLARARLGEEHIRTAEARLALGKALLATGEYAKAEPLLRAAAAAFDRRRRSQPILAAEADAALARLERRRTD